MILPETTYSTPCCLATSLMVSSTLFNKNSSISSMVLVKSGVILLTWLTIAFLATLMCSSSPLETISIGIVALDSRSLLDGT